MFTAALFTIARAWKNPTHPSTDEWTDVVQMYNGILLSCKKKGN